MEARSTGETAADGKWLHGMAGARVGQSDPAAIWESYSVGPMGPTYTTTEVFEK